MRVLVLFAHPLETSFLATLHARIVETLHKRGHKVDDLNLYVEGFDPVLSRQTFIDYLDKTANRARVVPVSNTCWRPKPSSSCLRSGSMGFRRF
jgi:NAD(P)H dehydrogenase (quinone)